MPASGSVFSTRFLLTSPLHTPDASRFGCRQAGEQAKAIATLKSEKAKIEHELEGYMHLAL